MVLNSILPSYYEPNFLNAVYRLGHREQKDEWVPRRVDIFQRHNVLPPNAVISAGSSNSACTAGINCYCVALNLFCEGC